MLSLQLASLKMIPIGSLHRTTPHITKQLGVVQIMCYNALWSKWCVGQQCCTFLGLPLLKKYFLVSHFWKHVYLVKSSKNHTARNNAAGLDCMDNICVMLAQISAVPLSSTKSRILSAIVYKQRTYQKFPAATGIMAVFLIWTSKLSLEFILCDNMDPSPRHFVLKYSRLVSIYYTFMKMAVWTVVWNPGLHFSEDI